MAATWHRDAAGTNAVARLTDGRCCAKAREDRTGIVAMIVKEAKRRDLPATAPSEDYMGDTAVIPTSASIAVRKFRTEPRGGVRDPH